MVVSSVMITQSCGFLNRHSMNLFLSDSLYRVSIRFHFRISIRLHFRHSYDIHVRIIQGPSGIVIQAEIVMSACIVCLFSSWHFLRALTGLVLIIRSNWSYVHLTEKSLQLFIFFIIFIQMHPTFRQIFLIFQFTYMPCCVQ